MTDVNRSGLTWEAWLAKVEAIRRKPVEGFHRDYYCRNRFWDGTSPMDAALALPDFPFWSYRDPDAPTLVGRLRALVETLRPARAAPNA